MESGYETRCVSSRGKLRIRVFKLECLTFAPSNDYHETKLITVYMDLLSSTASSVTVAVLLYSTFLGFGFSSSLEVSKNVVCIAKEVLIWPTFWFLVILLHSAFGFSFPFAVAKTSSTGWAGGGKRQRSDGGWAGLMWKTTQWWSLLIMNKVVSIHFMPLMPNVRYVPLANFSTTYSDWTIIHT